MTKTYPKDICGQCGYDKTSGAHREQCGDSRLSSVCVTCGYVVTPYTRCTQCGVNSGTQTNDQPTAALDTQVGGEHYKSLAIQPVEYVHKNGIGYIEGSVIKYVTRWRNKNGVEDLKKARHFLDILIALETAAVEKEL